MNLTGAIDLVEKGYVPDAIARLAMRRLIRDRLRESTRTYRNGDALTNFQSALNTSPLAVETASANAQHYEVPTEFFQRVLGKHLKYSCALFRSGSESLDEAEEAMLALTCERAQLEDGMTVLELGCGWGSLTLFMAARCPESRIVAVSNSRTQKRYIDTQAQLLGLNNISVITQDINQFEADQKFDRIVSVEMFEHVRNHQALFNRISSWLAPAGKLFVHIFCHRSFPYLFEDRGDSDWMARHFFSGGLMPSFDLPLTVQQSLEVEDRWAVSGMHYAQTCDHWLARCDNQADDISRILDASDDPASGNIQRQRWRMFFMACHELFAFDNGGQWHVGHYVFRHPVGRA